MQNQIKERVRLGKYVLSSYEQITREYPEFKREGMYFDSWNTKRDGSGERFESGQEIDISSDNNVYAEWKGGLVFTSINGKKSYYRADDPNILSTLRYQTGIGRNLCVNYPFNQDENISCASCLVSVEDFSENILSIGWFSFDDCENLEKVYFPKANMGRIQDCPNLKYVDFEGLTELGFGQYAFFGCDNIEHLRFNSLTACDFSYNFTCNEKINDIYAPNLREIWCADNIWLQICTNLSSIYINNDILKSIGDGFCYDNIIIVADSGTTMNSCGGAITSAYNEDIQILDTQCFGFSNIEYAVFPNVTSIGGYAFYYCSNLSSINCPNVSSIGGYAFESCSNLREIHMSAITTYPTLASTYAFYRIDNQVSVYVPSTVSFEGAPNWSDLISSGKIKIIECY